MIRIAICDDEKYMSDQIQELACAFFGRRNRETAIRRFSCGRELLEYDGQIDILFLDIQMKGMDGMETAKRLRAGKFRGFLIFITVLREMVFQSFEVFFCINRLHFNVFRRFPISMDAVSLLPLSTVSGLECGIYI